MKTHTASHHAIPLHHAHPPAWERAYRYVADRFLLLPLGAAIAFVWANTAEESYFQFAHSLSFAVNEVAMAVFLALVVHDVLEATMPGGALHSWRRWSVALVAAAGGAAGAGGAYLLYVELSHEVVLSEVWPVVCAVDVGAAYYVVKLIWRRGGVLPFVLLLTLATDALGLLFVALRPQNLVLRPGGALLMMAALGVAALLRARKVKVFWPYLVVSGTLSWWALYLEGIHPALALVPIVPFLPREPRSLDVFAEPPNDDAVHAAERSWSEFGQVVLFFFGLVNAGVILRQYDTATWAFLTAALAGRPVGILAATGLALAAGLRLPAHVGWRGLIVVALATSSGFTFALFFATSVIPAGPVLAQIKLGALASAAAGIGAIGVARLLRVGRFAR